MRTSKTVLPFYFGPTDRRLFGCYHEPTAGQMRDSNIVICQPIGHEYIYCHRALRQLATGLSDSGFPVLRFDYYGCGDSSGESEEGRLTQWLDDVSSAITEIRKITNNRKTCLVGVRLGAGLSYLTSAQRFDVGCVVLWDPVLSGNGYLKELYSLQKEALRLRPKPARQRSKTCTEIIGFPLPVELATEIEALDLLLFLPKPGTTVLTIRSDELVDDDVLKQHLNNGGIACEYWRVNAPKLWRPTVDGNLLVPNQLLQSIQSWTCAHA
jgi:uncharacterized protein